MIREPTPSRRSRFGLLAAMIVAVALLGGGVHALVSGPTETPRKIVPEIRTVRVMPLPPPPPPPPPPKEPPPPEPQKMVEAPKMQDPIRPERPQETPKANAPQAPGPLGLDAKGEGPGDAFGLSGRPGGGDLLGGGGGGSLAGWYGSVIATALYQAVSKDGRLEHASGEIRARIWLNPEGVPTKVELLSKFADPKLDAAFEDIVLHQLRPSDPPPKELPQPVTIRLRAQQPLHS